jgi:hypothetical protein
MSGGSRCLLKMAHDSQVNQETNEHSRGLCFSTSQIKTQFLYRVAWSQRDLFTWHGGQTSHRICDFDVTLSSSL